jgi:mRNA-degrading endonuclease RelE of RelBE toxin-antitoxin system
MKFTIIPNRSFLNDLKSLSKKYPSLKSDINNIVTLLKDNPTIGFPLGKDCFKIRVSIKSKGKGKSGGARLITCVRITKSTIYLLALFDKGDFDTISDKDIKQRLKEIE